VTTARERRLDSVPDLRDLGAPEEGRPCRSRVRR
jgi:hypothetical protein